MWKCYHRFNHTKTEPLLNVYIIRSMHLAMPFHVYIVIMSKEDTKKFSTYVYFYTYTFIFLSYATVHIEDKGAYHSANKGRPES